MNHNHTNINGWEQATAVLVRRHGIYIWGATWMQAKTQVRGLCFFPSFFPFFLGAEINGWLGWVGFGLVDGVVVTQVRSLFLSFFSLCFFVWKIKVGWLGRWVGGVVGFFPI